MSEIRNPGIKCGIRINKEAFKNFVSEKGSNLKEISKVLGLSHGALSAMLNRGTFTVYMLYRLSSLFKVEPKDMEFVDDPAHRLLYQLCIPFDGPRQKGNKIARIREYLAQGLDRMKISELMYKPPIKKENDPKIKAIPMTVPPATLTHSAVSEAFDEVANSEKKTLGNVISECAEKLVALDYEKNPFVYVSDINFEEYLKKKEMRAAETLASSVVEYFGRWSKVTTVNGDITLRLDKTETPVMQKEYHDWALVRDICRDTGIATKARPWLEVLYFMASSCVGIASRKEWEKAAHIIKFELSKESDFIGRYSIKNEEETENEGN